MGKGTGPWWSEKGAFLRLPIHAALWTLILVTLLSALAPLGPPLSRATGSAFNPATTDVVLKARTQSAQQVVEAPQPDGGGAPPLIIAFALAAVLTALRVVILTGWAGDHASVLPFIRPARTRSARAPPSIA
ncbi:hypothetical protein [Sphingobium sp. HWE2-09]|uniref:hypothetical protein n=1 Tax=Sphingobium sp. HWE2-09 TaxID=3108390 RepID=UPI002DC32BDA|nr:hypothetical protein [Sphingobium sp. HWE2-09]